MKIRLEQIKNLPYGECGENAEPSEKEINEAIQNGELEVRGFQSHKYELREQWYNNPDCARLAREYHARRIAYFVVNKWDDEVEVGRDNWLIEGGQGLRAARHLRHETIDCFKSDRTKADVRD